MGTRRRWRRPHSRAAGLGELLPGVAGFNGARDEGRGLSAVGRQRKRKLRHCSESGRRTLLRRTWPSHARSVELGAQSATQLAALPAPPSSTHAICCTHTRQPGWGCATCTCDTPLNGAYLAIFDRGRPSMGQTNYRKSASTAARPADPSNEVAHSSRRRTSPGAYAVWRAMLAAIETLILYPAQVPSRPLCHASRQAVLSDAAGASFQQPSPARPCQPMPTNGARATIGDLAHLD